LLTLGVRWRTGVYPVNPFTEAHAARATKNIEISLFIIIVDRSNGTPRQGKARDVVSAVDGGA
jgi:hypothetical protein